MQQSYFLFRSSFHIMGKKDGNKRKRNAFETEDADDQVDPELQAEIAAVMASRSEKVQDNEGITGNSKEKNTYNKEGLIKSLDGIETVNLPFKETLQICENEIIIQNENDDIEREVGHTLFLILYCYN